ncbi:MAG: hypothetical protein ACI39E_05040 [Acutalibacteraceae bacterium]
MKKSFFSVVLALAIVLTMSFSVLAIQASADGVGYDFLQESYITEGRQNVTINADGSWTVKGNFTLEPNITYNFSVYKYLFQDFTSDVEFKVTILDRDPNGVYEDHWIGLYDNWVGPAYFPVGTYKSTDGIDGIYNWNIAHAGWGNSGTATVRAIFVELNGTGVLTMRELRLSDNTTPTTATTTAPSQTWDSFFDLAPADPALWSSADAGNSQAVVSATGSSLNIGNTAGAYPSAFLSYREPACVLQSDAAIKYDFTANGKTNIYLFFTNSTPDNFHDGEYISLNPAIAGVADGADISGHYEGYVYLKDLELPAGAYDENGKVKITGIKVFAISDRAASDVVTVDELLLLYNENATEQTTTTQETTTTQQVTTTAENPSATNASSAATTTAAGSNSSPKTGEADIAVLLAIVLAGATVLIAATLRLKVSER